MQMRKGWMVSGLVAVFITGGGLGTIVGSSIEAGAEERRYRANNEAAAQEACRQAEIKLRDAGRLFSPGFPGLMCRSSYVTDQPVPWDLMVERTKNAQPLIAHCRKAYPQWANRLQAAAAMSSFLRSYESSLEHGEGQELEVLPGWEDVRALPNKDPLRIARAVERALDRLEFEFSSGGTDLCSDPRAKAQWQELHGSVTLGIESLVGAAKTNPDARGCAWMFRAELADLESIGCGTDREAKLVEAAVGYQRAMALGDDRNMLVDAVVGAMQSATHEIVTLSAEREAEIRTRALFELKQDAETLGDRQMQSPSDEVAELLAAIKRGPSGFVAWRTDFLAQRWNVDQRAGDQQLGNGLRLADAWLDAGQPDEARSVLLGLGAGGASPTATDYRYHVLLGKALCLANGGPGMDQAASESLTTAIALNGENFRGNSPLGRQWGRAEILKPLCQVAAAKLNADELPPRFEQINLTPDVCDLLSVASFRQRLQKLASAFTEKWIAECEL